MTLGNFARASRRTLLAIALAGTAVASNPIMGRFNVLMDESRTTESGTETTRGVHDRFVFDATHLFRTGIYNGTWSTRSGRYFADWSASEQFALREFFAAFGTRATVRFAGLRRVELGSSGDAIAGTIREVVTFTTAGVAHKQKMTGTMFGIRE